MLTPQWGESGDQSCHRTARRVLLRGGLQLVELVEQAGRLPASMVALATALLGCTIVRR